MEQQLTTLLSSSETELSQERKLRAAVEESQKSLDDTQASLEELRTGVITHPQRTTLRQKLTNTEMQLKTLETEAKQLEAALLQWNTNLAQSESQVGQDVKALQDAQDDVQRHTRTVETLKTKVDTLRPRVDELVGAKAKYVKLEARMAELEEMIDDAKRKTFQVTRHHQENPDGRQQGIQGMALELLRIYEKDVQFATALEEAGKSRLFNIVVDNDEVAKQLLEKYKALRRVTCIPLNRIQAPEIPEKRLQEAKEALGLSPESEDIRRPMDVLTPTSPEYYKALVFVFGQTFLCTSPKLGQLISQHPKIKSLAVTLDGDQYNPSGSVSGGSQAGLGGILLCYRKLQEVLREQDALRIELKDLQNYIHEVEETVRQHDRFERDLQAAEERLKQLHGLSNDTQINLLRNKIETATSRLRELRSKEIPQLTDVELPQLRDAVEKTKQETREATVQRLESQAKEAKKKLKQAQQALEEFERTTSTASRQVAVLREQIQAAKKQLAAKEKEGTLLEMDLKNAQEAERQCAQTLAETQEALQKANHLMREKGAKYRELEERKKDVDAAADEADAEIAKLHHTLRCYKQNLLDFGKRRSALLRDFPWLESVEPTFNQPGSDFVFTKETTADCFDRLDALKRSMETLQRQAGRDVSAVLESAENELQALKAKKSQLARDKEKLEEFIEELDSKKTQTLHQCWQQVNANFSAIFSMLLPGSDAHLDALPGESLKSGLEIKVVLAGVSKSSLAELSGGQRALLALSLILALLKYKPAPLYILDEIDAALDLSHTQKIGRMIKTQFQGSQFLIVSLKENLFNYADVLFRTAFVNGSSQVTRRSNSSEDNDDDDRIANENQAPTKRSRGR